MAIALPAPVVLWLRILRAILLSVILDRVGHAKVCVFYRWITRDRPSAPQPQPASDYQVSNKWVARALLVLEQNLSRPLSTDEIASRLNISKRQLERLFIAETGDSLQKFYRKIRLNYGLWLLQNTQRLITDIAQETGFADTAHFSRAFRAAFAKKPTECR